MAYRMATVVLPTTTRVLNSALAQKIMGAEEAAGLIKSGDQIGMSGFTGSGYPKLVPIELAHRIATGELDLTTPGLSDHLWATTMAKLAVDQPTYAAYRAELEGRAGETT